MSFVKAYGTKKRVKLDTGSETMTQQSFKKECDVNYILRKYQKTGLIDHVNTYNGDYSDVSSVPSYQQALEIVQDANTMFASLPSSIRKEFSNDPEKFLNFVSDEKNSDRMRLMGLLPNSDIRHDVDSNHVTDSASADHDESGGSSDA